MLQASFIENTKILCNERDCPQGLSFHKIFFFSLENKIGDSQIARHSGKRNKLAKT